MVSRSTSQLASILLVVVCALQTPRAATAAPSKRPPNIVLILCDDLGITNIGYHGADKPFYTPNIDGLANQGLRFDRCALGHLRMFVGAELGGHALQVRSSPRSVGRRRHIRERRVGHAAREQERRESRHPA